MNAPAPEFSRIVSVSRISPKGIEELLETRPAERAALAKRFDLVDLPVLKARLTLIPGSRQTIEATGTIEAEIVQRCVVTLDPIVSRLDLHVNVVFLPAESGLNAPDELNDEFEYFSGGKIDVGELISQQLGVSIDPYPRKADAALTKTEFGKKTENTLPLAKLRAAVKKKKNNKNKKENA
jgi:uncharacterized metal-binding protein YceD (DUF177 family)